MKSRIIGSCNATRATKHGINIFVVVYINMLLTCQRMAECTSSESTTSHKSTKDEEAHEKGLECGSEVHDLATSLSEKTEFFNFLGLGDREPNPKPMKTECNSNIDNKKKKHRLLFEFGSQNEGGNDAGSGGGEGEDAEENKDEIDIDRWEDCMDHIEPLTSPKQQQLVNTKFSNGSENLLSNVVTPRRSGVLKRIARKRKLCGGASGTSASTSVTGCHDDSLNINSTTININAAATSTVCVCKKASVNVSDDGDSALCSKTSTPSAAPVVTPRTPRAVIPTRDNPPPEMNDWLNQFQVWSNAERILALNEVIQLCTPVQVRHIMQTIEPQFQRDFISLLPRELALSVLSFLGPRDLARAAQTCRSWRYLAEDNLLWREKCREEGVAVGGGATATTAGTAGGWKGVYMRQHAVAMNWWSNELPTARLLKGHDDHVITCLQFHGNRIVSGSDDNTLKVWSAMTGRCLRTLVGHTGGVWSSQMSDEVIVSGSTDRTLKVWDLDSGICLHTLYGHTSTVRCMHLHKGKVVSGSRDATLRLWDVGSGQCEHVLMGHQAAVRCVQYDGRLVVSGAYDYKVKVWCPEREECLHTLVGHTNRVYSLQFDGVHVVSGSLDTSIRVWEVETGACKHQLMGHQSLTSGMELRNNILVSGNADSTVKVWDIISGQCLQTLSGPSKHQSAVTCLQFNSRFVITSSDDGTVKLWCVRTGDFIRNLVTLESGGSGGVVWRIRASDTKLVCAVGSRNGTEETKLLVLDFDCVGGSKSGRKRAAHVAKLEDIDAGYEGEEEHVEGFGGGGYEDGSS